jgi:hypothetical protein
MWNEFNSQLMARMSNQKIALIGMVSGVFGGATIAEK